MELEKAGGWVAGFQGKESGHRLQAQLRHSLSPSKHCVENSKGRLGAVCEGTVHGAPLPDYA